MSYNSGSTSGYAAIGNDVFVNASGQLIDGSGNVIALALSFRMDATNTASGVNAYPIFVSGGQNTAVGAQALGNSVLTGQRNVAVGYRAAASSVAASDNVAVGNQALESLVNNASAVTAVGSLALQKLTAASGNNTTAVGYQALGNTTSGANNVAVGYQANLNRVSGNENVLLGSLAGNTVASTGAGNICIGYATSVVDAAGSYNIVLGDGAATLAGLNSGNGQLVLGSAGHPLYLKSTVGAAGGGSALPAAPIGYMQVILNGTQVAIPYYNF